MRKNWYNRILKNIFKKQHLNTVPNFVLLLISNNRMPWEREREEKKKRKIIINDLTIPPPNQKSKQTLSLFLFTGQSAREIACITLLLLLKLNGLHTKANVACTKVTHMPYITFYTLKIIDGWSQIAIHVFDSGQVWVQSRIDLLL